MEQSDSLAVSLPGRNKEPDVYFILIVEEDGRKDSSCHICSSASERRKDVARTERESERRRRHVGAVEASKKLAGFSRKV